MSSRIWSPLHARLHQLLRDRQLLPQRSRLLIAVSGGQDSLCLLALLRDLQPLWHWHLAIVHCDHRWREDSQANADQVKALAEIWQLPFYLAVATVPPKSEAVARDWRYDCCLNLALTHQFDRIVTGHTASDRAETLLYNLVRGSGADGLQALEWVRSLTDSVQVVRPLLAITRHETGQFCHAARLPIWEDSTNQDLQYQRNRIRQELIPYLQHQFNPQVETHLAQTCELLSAEVEYLESEAATIYHQVVHRSTSLKLDRNSLRARPIALQRRVIRRMLQEELGIAANFRQIEKIRGLLEAPQRSQTDPFPGGAIARVEETWICFIASPLPSELP